jgi:hypothetical protein
MSRGVQKYPCTVCGNDCRSVSRCKELAPPPPDGFYKPAPGQHQHDDDEDEAINLAQIQYSYRKWYQKVIKMHKARKLVSP